MLEVSRCRAAYGGLTVFDEISFRLDYGRTAAVVGPSGCGKSTLLALLAGIKSPRAGQVVLDGADVIRGDRRVGLILQHYGLFPWMTVSQNVALGLRLRGMPPAQRRTIVYRELQRLEIEEYAGRYPGELSGGQQQRVAIARTFAVGPQLLLMDEPFSALDALTRERIQDALVRRLAGGRVVTIFVTHSIEEAVFLGTSVMVFEPGAPARIRILENEHRLEPSFRMSALYGERCRSVRSILEASHAP
ncbi:MAG TPA: ATP-binding cassette domain-containing protein [Spirochaetia bacterium]|nr:ATP-binding cassette domain-containing protein [Spirochaetia bacterium]